MPALSVQLAPDVWEAALGQLLLRVTRQNFDNWLRNTTGLRFEGTSLVVGVPNDFTCEWLSARMRAVINQALTCVAGPGLSARFEALPAVDGGVNAMGEIALQASMLPQHGTPLNARFSFSSFMAGDSNRLALEAAHDLVTNPDSIYTPLLITGDSGSGKTHLLHAIGHEAARQGLRYLLVTGEQFLSEFTTSVRGRSGAAFRARYRDLDLLLVDDVQILAGKKATQSEFFQTIACLHDAGRRVAITCDRSSGACDAAARFRSDLRWGLVAHIEPSSIEERVRFVASRATCQRLDLAEPVQHYIALRVKSSMRDLEGAMNRINALTRISPGEPVTIDFVARALQPVAAVAPQEKSSVRPNQLLDAVSVHLSVAKDDIAGQRRDRHLTYARHLAMYLLRRDSGLTYSAIASLLGKKDHSTVVHACRQVDQELKVSAPLRADIDAIRSSIHTSLTAA